MPLLSIRNVDASSRLAIWNMTESPEELKACYPMLDLPYEEACQRFKSQHRRKEFLSIRALLIEMSDGRLPEVCYDANGKPSLGDGRKVSFSHTQGYAVVLMSENDEVGVDIECKGDRVAKVAHKFLRDDEFPSHHATASSSSAVDGLSIDALLVMWSAKEAVYKLFSAQNLAFEEMRIAHFSPQPQGRIIVENLKKGVAVEVEYQLTDDYALTLCRLPECVKKNAKHE